MIGRVHVSERCGSVVVEIISYRNRRFNQLRHVDEAAVFGGMKFENCEFSGCTLSQVVDPTYPIKVEDVTISGGNFVNNNALGILFENVTVSDCSTSGRPMIMQGCAYKNVTLRGRLGSWIFNDMNHRVSLDLRQRFLESERDFYREVDYILDISEAVFEAADMYYIPGDLVRRDPKTQFLVRKSKLVDMDLSEIPKRTQRLLRRVEENPYDSTVIVAARNEEDFGGALSDFQQLVDLGIAEC
jgi:hypothetical protein